MRNLTYEHREQIEKAAHRQRNREIRRFLTRLIELPKLRQFRWIAAHRAW